MTEIRKSKLALRQEAEAMIDSQDIQLSYNLEKLSLHEVQKIVHELEVHQVELKLQNEEQEKIQEELEKIKKRYFDLYDMAPIAYCTLNKNGLIEEANLELTHLLLRDREKLIKQPFSHFIHKEDQDIYYMYCKKIFKDQKKKIECQLRVLNSEHKSCWVYLTATQESDTVHLMIKDISERKIFEDKLELLASVFHNAGEAVMITELDGTIKDTNEAFTKITGYTKEDVVGKKPDILHSGLQSKEYYRQMWASLKDIGSWKGEIWNKKKNGEIYAEMLIINTVYDYYGKAIHYVALFSDITGMKEYENSLKNIAHFDQLTKLPNRVLLADRLENGMIQNKRNKQYLAVIFLDLDGFKEVNDTYGHDVGDKLLVQLAKEMKLTLREGDTLARIGGDEFVAVLFDLDKNDDALPIINRLLKSASQTLHIGKELIQVSASLGVTFSKDNQIVDADLLLRQADQAMYQAKLAGKNRYHFFNTQETDLIREHFEKIERVRQALKNKEFVLYYQPKINMSTGAIIGAEALIRWNHPEKGIIPPLEFLPEVEGHALSVEIGEWVLHTALEQLKTCHKKKINIVISVNIGAQQILEENFVSSLENLLSQYPTVDPKMLELEVLETSRLEDIDIAKKRMHDCIKLGVSFSLDDFGTGYSSLVYLKQLPIKQIKIDQGFVRDMLSNPNDLSILEGIIGLGEAFHRSVIAEGVETSEHATVLLGLGCELAQGYAIARPMPVAQFNTWLKEYKPNTLWQNTPVMNSNQKQILYIEVEHRAWVERIKAIINEAENRENRAIDECIFGKWLEDGGEKYLGSNYKKIDSQHKHIHAFAEKLLTLHADGKIKKAQAGLNELYLLRDKLLYDLKTVNAL
jgi:diguanylate cyclase (GGDEF)-like protein/PAS domain S-box-containing protein